MRSHVGLQRLRQQLAALELRGNACARSFRLGLEAVDGRMGGLRADALHEVLALAPRHAVAAQGFALALAMRATAHTVVWILQSGGRSELGEPYGPGLSAWGLDPADLLLVRANAAPAPSAAETRWSIASAASASMPANAPGRPAFRARLLRSRAGAPPGEWMLEWDREARTFVVPTPSGGVVPVPADRPAGAGAVGRSRAA